MDPITLADIEKAPPETAARFHTATHTEIEKGWTTDLYFVRTRDLLEAMGLARTEVTAEIFASREGLFAGSEEALYLLRDAKVQVWSLPEGERMSKKEVVMRIKGDYGNFGIYETPLLGMLASASGWAGAARECKEAAGGRTLLCFGARHVHPAVAPVMERAALLGGADGCSCILGARLLARKPSGTVPHAAFLIAGDSVELALAYDRYAPAGDPRVILVDTFKDEAEETLRVARALGKKLSAIRLDTPAERGGVTPALVREVRARLDQAGFGEVRIVASGGLDPEKISILAGAGADIFGVGSYISRAPAVDMTMDLKEIRGEAIAKRGRIPGLTDNPRLVRMM